MATDETTPPKRTLDDLLADFDADPTAYKPNLYVSLPFQMPNGGVQKNVPGETLGPITGLTAPIDLDFVWRELVARLASPGDVVCRLLAAPGKPTKNQTVGVSISEAAVARWAIPPTPRAPPPPPPVQYHAPAVASGPPPSTDLVTAILLGQQKSQEQTQNLINTMLSTLTKEKSTDPYMQTLIAENKALIEKVQTLTKEPSRLEQNQWDKALEFGKELAGKENSGLALLADPISSLSKSIERTVDKSSMIAEKKAEADVMRADAELTRERIALLKLQMEAAGRGLLDMSPEDHAKGRAALDEVEAAERAASAVEAAKQKTSEQPH